MKLLKQTLLFTISLLLLYSCSENKYYYSVALNANKNTKKTVEETDTGKFVIVKYYINDTINKSNKFILETSYNFYFEAYQDTNNIIAKFEKGEIKNQEINFIDTDRIPITPYFTNRKFVLNNILDINKPLYFKFKKDFKSYKKLQKLKLWTVLNEELDVKTEHKFNIETENYFEKSNLPILKINIDTSISEKKYFAKYELINNKTQINSVNDTAELIGMLKIKLRGQTSKQFPKRSYSITFYDKHNKKQNIDILDMPKEHDWVLYGPYVDVSLMRNVLAYNMYSNMGYYSPRTKYCQLVINNDYRGIYVLIEKIKRDKNRVNIRKFKREKIDNDFIVKIDKGSGINWMSPYKSEVDTGWGKWFYYVYPKYKKMNDKQRVYIQESITKLETAIKENNNWKELLNINSFIDYMIVNEVFKNIDAYRLSTYMYKDSTNKISIGPIWDFNFSLGLTKYNDGSNYAGLVYKGDAVPFWWKTFMNDKEFKTQLRKRWGELRKTYLSIENLNEVIDKNTEYLKKDIEKNNQKWNVLNSTNDFKNFNPKTYNQEIYYIKYWIEKRIIYLDKKF